LKAIQAAMEGQSYLCPEVAKIVVQACVDAGPSSPDLTQEELCLVTRLAQGCSAKDIATQEDLSVKTVEGRRRRLLRKLNIDSMAELVHYAIAEGLIEAPTPH
ncbi:MAG: response regulator transcription factor, partial [Planctomycetes bacterium]|nr:response regulator transcription factor [Planctomycetota bacterium]